MVLAAEFCILRDVDYYSISNMPRPQRLCAFYFHLHLSGITDNGGDYAVILISSLFAGSCACCSDGDSPQVVPCRQKGQKVRFDGEC